MTARATSIYSLRYTTSVAATVLDRMTTALAHTGTPRQDSHVRTEDGRTYAAVGFRADSDDHARRIAGEVLDFAALDAARGRLLTGFGSARREVSL